MSDRPSMTLGGRSKSLLLMLSTLLVMAALFEAGVRLFSPQPLFAYRFSEATWYEPTPGASFVYPRTEFRTEVRYNESGFRGPLPDPAPAPDALRIVVVGDSYVEGLEVEESDTMTARLGAALTDRLGRPVEAINLGVSGFSTVQSLRRLETKGFALAPDLVVYLASQNDFADNVDDRSRRLYDWTEANTLTYRPAQVSTGGRLAFQLKDALKSRFMSYQFVRSRLQTLRFRGAPDPSPDGSSGPGADQIKTMRAALIDLHDRCRSRGVRLLTSIVTSKTVGSPTSVVPAFEEICRAESIPFVDLRPEFARTIDAGQAPFFVIDGHWNASGHALAASIIADAAAPLLEGAHVNEEATHGG